MSIKQVIDIIETRLLEDADWGNSILWGNLDSFQNDYDVDETPVTCVSLDGSNMLESSTQSDHVSWEFTIKGVFYLGEKSQQRRTF